jgi:hypothetical protein
MTTTHAAQPLSREEIAWLMRALFSALQSPKWTFGNRKDLEKLGEAIISGKKLKELDSELLDRIFPYLLTITNHLGNALKAKVGEETEPLAREETAWLMRAIWEALQSPDWASQNRKDIEKLGEALYSGKELRDLGDKILDRIFPHLVTVTTHLGDALAAKAAEDDGAPEEEPAAPAAAPAAPPVAAEEPKAPAVPPVVATEEPPVQPSVSPEEHVEPSPATPEIP